MPHARVKIFILAVAIIKSIRQFWHCRVYGAGVEHNTYAYNVTVLVAMVARHSDGSKQSNQPICCC